MGNRGICKLCCLERQLVKAHVIPEFFYKPLYDNGEFVEVTVENLIPNGVRRRKGIYDDRILCKECDNGIINKRYDDYASKALWGYSNLRASISDFYSKDDPNVKWRVATGIDSGRFKLFLLSVLWRAHISNLPLFEEVNLGNLHGDRIRQMILKNDSGKRDEYPIIVMNYSIGNSNIQKLISKINKYKKNGRTYYAAALSGILVIWYFSEHLIPESLRSSIIGAEENKISILHSPHQGGEFLSKFLGDEFIKYAIDH